MELLQRSAPLVFIREFRIGSGQNGGIRLLPLRLLRRMVAVPPRGVHP